jgi:hypothetical protein
LCFPEKSTMRVQGSRMVYLYMRIALLFKKHKRDPPQMETGWIM